MWKYSRAAAYAAAMILVAAAAGCGPSNPLSKDRAVAKISAEYVFDTKLNREVKHSKEIIRTRERNIFYGFSPLRELKLMRGNLGYLLQQTALVLPAGSLSRWEVSTVAWERAKATADEAYQRLMDGESWDEINMEYSAYEFKEGGGKMPPFTREYKRIPEDFFVLKPGEVLAPVETPYGYDIYRLDEITLDESGTEQFHASRVLVVPSEEEVKAEMIDEVLSRKQVEILDPVIKGFDIYIHGDYEKAIEYLENKSPAPDWPDLGYYVLSLCARGMGDAEGRQDYLLAAIEHSPERGQYLSYYELEIGDILRERGEDESAKEHYRLSFDGSPNDYDIVVMTLRRFEEIGDEEYAEIALARKTEMEAMIKRMEGGGPADNEVATGEVRPDKPGFEDL
jgi:tetratricopeptide (TPR) repeat protein